MNITYLKDRSFKAIKAKTTEQLWHEFVGNVLSLELADILPKWAEQDRLSQFEEDMQTRVRESL